MRILFTGGGTGGHLFPIIAVARELKKATSQVIPSQSSEEPLPSDGQPIEMFFVGPQTIGDDIFEKEEIKKRFIQAGKLRRYFSGHNIIDIFRILIGIIESFWILYWIMPNVIFSKGGFGSVPIVIVAWFYRIPVLVHESDTIPGLSVRLSAKLSKRIAVSFSRAADYFPAKKTANIGNPIRSDIINGSVDEAIKLFNISRPVRGDASNGVNQKPVLLILGGSQGAKAINDIIFLSMRGLLERCEIIHQCGQENFEELKLTLGNTPPEYHLFPFLNEEQMKQALAIATLVVARAGAGTIFEIAACGKPSMLIPLPNSASDHQKHNAYEYARTGATLVVDQANLTPNFLKDRIFSLLDDPALLTKMSEAAKSFAKPDADKQIAQELLAIAKH